MDYCRTRNDLVFVLADKRFLTVQRDARKRIAAVQSLNRYLFRNVGCGCIGRVVLALRIAVVGIGLIVCRDRQVNRVVNDDDVAFGLDRDRSFRIRGITRQIERAERVVERRIPGRNIHRCAEVRAAGGIVCDPDLRTLQVVVDDVIVRIDRPLRIEGDLVAVRGGLVGEVGLVRIRRAGAVCFGVPTGEGIALAGVCIRIQVLRHIVGERLICHLLTGAFVLVKVHRVRDRSDLDLERNRAVGHRERVVAYGNTRIRIVRSPAGDVVDLHVSIGNLQFDLDTGFPVCIRQNVRICYREVFRCDRLVTCRAADRAADRNAAGRTFVLTNHADGDRMRKLDMDMRILPTESTSISTRMEIGRRRTDMVFINYIVLRIRSVPFLNLTVPGSDNLELTILTPIGPGSDPFALAVLRQNQRVFRNHITGFCPAAECAGDIVLLFDPLRIEMQLARRVHERDRVGGNVPLMRAFRLRIPTIEDIVAGRLAFALGIYRIGDMIAVMETGLGHIRLRGSAFIILVENGFVFILRPDRVEVDHVAVGCGQVLDALRVVIFLAAVCGRRPAEERIAIARVGVLGQVLRHVVGELLIVHLRAASAVCIKVHGVGDRLPLCEHRMVLCAVADKVLVRRDLGYLIRESLVRVILAVVVVDVQIGQRRRFAVFFITADPAFEQIAGTFRC